MRKLWLAGLLLLACSAWVAAQTGSSSNSSGSAGTNASSSGTSQSGNSSSGTASQAGQAGISEPGNSSTGTASQQSGQSGASNAATEPQSSEIRETTIQGCLRGSSGNYTLTDQMGNVHKLQGADAKLSQHVSQEIEVKGYQTSANNASGSNTTSPSGSTATSTSGSASSSVAKGESPAAFRVHQITQIASTCSTQK